MNNPYVFLATVLITLRCVSVRGREDELCSNEARNNGWGSNLTIRSKRNDTGHWIATFDSFQEAENSTETLYLDLKQRVVVCDGREIVHIQGTIGDYATKNESGKLRFSSRFGKNAMVTNNGLTAYRKNSENDCCYSGVVTSRTLMPDELFEVKMEKMSKKRWSWSINIGITTTDPKDMEFPEQLMNLKSRTWIMLRNAVYFNGTLLKDNYGRNLHDMLDGDSVGIMRKSSGNLHMYINRIDQGIAAKDIPYFVYGIVDVKSNTVQVSIVDSSTP